MNRYIKRHKGLFVAAVCINIITGLVPVYLAYVIQVISDVAFNGHFERLAEALILCLLFLVYSFVSTSLNSIMKAKYRRVLKADISNDLYSSLMCQSYSEFQKKSTGSKLALFTNDIKMVDESYFFPLLTMIGQIIVAIVILIYVVRINIYVCLMMILIALITLMIPKFRAKRMSKLSNRLSSYAETYNSKLKEIFQSFDVIHDYGVLPSFLKKGKQIVSTMEKRQGDVNASISLTGNWSNSVAATGQLVYMVVIGVMILYGHIDKIYLMPVINISNDFISAICEISSALSGFKSVEGVSQKLLAIIDEKNEGKEIQSNCDNGILFKNVDFGYNSELLLKDFSFHFEKGKKYVIVGDSGSGKSTLLKIILNYYPIHAGSVNLLDYHHVSVIHQESHIFNDTLRNNLSLGMDIEESQLKKCLEFVGLENFDLDQIVSEDGGNISGGQLQRISIARAMAHLKEVLLCDEITSSLDNTIARKIEHNILDLENETVLYVTHKLYEDTLSRFDQILMMRNGTILECGTFDELMDKKQSFYHLYTNREK